MKYRLRYHRNYLYVNKAYFVNNPHSWRENPQRNLFNIYFVAFWFRSAFVYRIISGQYSCIRRRHLVVFLYSATSLLHSHLFHVAVIKWKHFHRYWPFVRGIHRSPVNSPHKGQWRGALMFSLICVWINGWVNNREAGDLRRNLAHYDVIVMSWSYQNRFRREGKLWVLIYISKYSILIRSL